jgi:hypothetical protein
LKASRRSRTLGADFVLLGNSTYAGATAAMVANVVLVAYVVVAFQSDGYKAEEKEKIAKEKGAKSL